MTRIFSAFAALLFGMATSAAATTVVADVELDYFNSGLGDHATGYYGGDTLGSGYPIQLADSANALDGNGKTFVSLPTGSYITLGFSKGYVFDGVGDDLVITETGVNSVLEHAEVWISSNLGSTFTLLGIASSGTHAFDLASINYTDRVNAVKLVGLDLLGGSKGFDLASIAAPESSVEILAVPLPAGGLLLLSGLAAFALIRRRKAA